MYSTPYGYPNPAGGPAFNGAPPPQNPHLQPGPSQGQPQQMMYNTQQFPMGAQGGGHFPGGPNPAMMGGAGPAGMMQNAALPHMAANGQMPFQTPYTSSPYGVPVPSPAAPQPQLPGNYMIAGQMPPQYQMGAGMHPQQQMMQRMHPSQQQNPGGMPGSTPQRPPFNPAQGTPNNAMQPQQPGQYPNQPQPHSGTPQSQTPTSAQPPSASVATPQTPTFSSTGQPGQANGASSVSTPQSPGTESREKEKFELLLDINQELLYETVTLLNSKTELKKEQAAGNSEIDYVEQEKMAQQDYVQCMRRLQTNLSCLAALADRKVQVPPAPILTPPSLNPKIIVRMLRVAPDDNSPGEKTPDPIADRAERAQGLKDLYMKLQALFPGVDPRKEPGGGPQGQQGQQQQQHPNPGMMMKGGPNGQQQAAPGGQQGSNQGSPAPPGGGQAQMTPQMGHAPAPMLQQLQPAGS
ncbi:hypothetical protein B0H66DRAFT_533811 [Apodospora peruviana]|uniref:Glutamine repeat protein-1 n=1 Tax=Apodospora peruviana TaxID=516989 RepID=A0AAE0M5D4_9PEZI|nr:hypothetical protein B0H66DRAFT_533811 [Apodospora peruviana]